MNRLIAIILLLVSLCCCPTARAQEYRFEVGPMLGVTGYFGDANNSNIFKHPGIGGGAMFRYILNSRWAFKANLCYGGIKGNTADIQTRYPIDDHIKFTASLYDLGVQAEFNFLNFGAGAKYKNYKRWSPYMVLGPGLVLASARGKTAFAMSLALGVGLKFKCSERLNLGLEFTMRKSLGDGIDGIEDLYGISHGFAKNTDWYCFALFSVSYEFSKRCTKCHYID